MVEVFKSDIAQTGVAAAVAHAIRARFPGHHVTFDLADCDKILRVEGRTDGIDAAELVRLARSAGAEIEPLPD